MAAAICGYITTSLFGNATNTLSVFVHYLMDKLVRGVVVES